MCRGLYKLGGNMSDAGFNLKPVGAPSLSLPESDDGSLVLDAPAMASNFSVAFVAYESSNQDNRSGSVGGEREAVRQSEGLITHDFHGLNTQNRVVFPKTEIVG
jgi:hypothetical protein